MNTTYFKNLVMNHTFGRGATPNTLPSAYYLGLSATAPTAAGGNVTEPATAAGYARVTISEAIGNASDGVISNTTAISFAESTAAWGTVTHLDVYKRQVKHSYVYANIILEICGYSFYNCTLETEHGNSVDRIIISKRNLSVQKEHEIKIASLGSGYTLDVTD